MPIGRTRTRQTAGNLGFYKEVSAIPRDTSREDEFSYQSSCSDTLGLRDNAFTVSHRHANGHRINHYVALNASGTQYKLAREFPLTYFLRGGGAPVAHQLDPSRPSNSALAVQVLAATSPSKPVVDLPVSLLELRELPHLLHTIGDSLIKTFAKKELNREFGLTPMMSDVLGLLKFSTETAKRVELFKQLREKPLCRKAGLWSGSVVTEPGNIVATNSTPFSMSHKFITNTTSRQIWGYVTWTPDETFTKQNLAYADPALEYLARRAVLGAQVGLVTLWNAVPWSWLIDWYGNIGDWLEANRQVIPARPSIPRICETIRTERFYTLAATGLQGLSPGSVPVTTSLVTKSRDLASAALPSAHMPLLTGRQVKILASLAILRS